MKLGYIFFVATMSTISSLICMEPEPKVSPAELPDLEKPCHYINFDNRMEAFDALTQNNAALLSTLVGKEKDGKYSETLHKSEHLLHKIRKIRDFSDSDSAQFVRERYEIDFVVGITNKQRQREWLITAFNQNDLSHFKWVLSDNCYVANAYGSSIPYKNKKVTPLHHILLQAKAGQVDESHAKQYATILLQHGANPNAYDDEGNTPLYLASTPGLIILLLKFGGKGSLKNKNGLTPLMHHISLKNDNLAKQLMYFSNAINKQDAHGNTALFYAVEREMADIVRALLRNDADCTLSNRKGNIITDIAHGEIFEIIQQHLQHTLCHALKDNSHIQHIVSDAMMVEFQINGKSIMAWAKEHCRDKQGYLFHAVIEFNKLLIRQLISGSYKMGKLALEEDGACINMVNPHAFSTNGYLALPFTQVIQQGDEKKIILLLDNGAIVTEGMLTDTIENQAIHTLLQTVYNKQCCCKCNKHVERMCIQLDHDYQICMICHSCKRSNGSYL